MKGKWLITIVVAFVLGLGWSLAWGKTVKVTPLGAAEGEFCVGDRAILFEDPSGVRVLIAPGRTVNGSGDPRIEPVGSVHVLLLDHVHTDHIGDVFHTTCAGPPTTDFAFPDEGNAPEIAAVHNSAVLVGGELPAFLTRKIQNITGTVPVGCPAAGLDNTLTVPRTTPCVGVIRGGTRTVIFSGESEGVKVTTISAFHAAGADPRHIDAPGLPPGLTGYTGSETGYIIRFTNGLTVLWTGDSGLIGDWRTQSRFYKPNLALVHMGDLFTMGPDEAAFAVRSLIRPKSVIPEHANQVSTSGGVVNPGTRVERFINQMADSGIAVHVPLSGVTMEFDGSGTCVAGC